MLDLRTLMLIYLITNVINAGSVAFIWHQNRKRFAGMPYLMAAVLLQVAGPFLHIMRGKVPDLISMTLSNTMILAGFILLLMGLERFAGKQGRQLHNFILLAVFMFIHAWFAVVQPNLAVRDIALSAMIMTYALQCAWLLLRRADRGIRDDTRLTGIVCGAYALFSFARVILNLAFPEQTNDFFKSGAVNELAITGYIVLNLFLVLSLVLMVSRRLLANVITQEQKFSIAFQTSPYAITITRASDGKFLETNDAFTSITGYTREEAMADSSVGLNLWADPGERKQMVSILFTEGKVESKEVRFNKRNGDILTGLFSAKIINLNDESYILSSIDDITGRKKMEESLRMEQQFSASVIDSLPGIFYVYTYPDLRLIRYNRNHEVVLGMDPGELKDRSVRDWKFAEAREPVIAAMEEVMKNGRTRIEAPLYAKDGRQIPFILTGVRLEVPDQTYIMGVGIDVTHLKLAEAEIKLKNEQLVKLNAEKDKFFSIIAHDLRSPFTAFLGFTRMLDEDLLTMMPGEIQKIAHALRNSASNIYRLLENLLEWSLMQRGIKSFTKESFLLKPKIAGSIELMLDSAHAKDIGINFDVPDDMMITADVHMIETVIRNLVSNAVKFTGSGGEIFVKARMIPGTQVEISITDTGIGMNKDYLDRLFRIDGETSRKGTNGEGSNGLGLIICKDFIEKNGGKVWVESEEGKGSTFSFSIPCE